MMKSAFILFRESAENLDKIMPKYSTGYIVGPEENIREEAYYRVYCRRKYPEMVLKDSFWTDEDVKPIDSKCIVVVVPEAYPEPVLKKLDNNLVIPSACFLDNTQILVSSFKKVWKFFKYTGELTRAGSDEGIIQWGHLIHDLAFCLGHASKYGA